MKTSKLINLFLVLSLTIVLLGTPSTTLAQAISGAISGVVTDEATGQPLANVWVHLLSSGSGGCSNASGNYMITGLNFGSYQVEAQAGAPWCGNNTTLDYASEWWPEAVSLVNAGSITLSTESPNATNINFTLGPGGTISGTVRNVNGNILPNIYVSADGIEAPNPAQGACTDNQGVFTVSGLPSGYSYIVSAGYNYCGTSGLAVEYWQESANFANVVPVVVSESNPLAIGIDFTLLTTNETDIGSTYVFEIVESNTINADYWPEGIPITLTIDDPATIPSVDYTSTATPSIDNPSTFGFIEGFTLAPGMIVTVTNGNITKKHIITNLVVEGTDIGTDRVFGSAYPYSAVWIACGDDRISRFVIANSAGHWEADFGNPGPTDQEQDLCDLQPGVGGFAIEGGGDLQNDFTMDTWNILPEQIDYFALGDSIASGHGLLDDGTKCQRSGKSYPHKVAELLRAQGTIVNLYHLACSGATAGPQYGGLTNEDNILYYKWLTHQVNYVENHLTNHPTLVTINIGANDLGWTDPEVFTDHLYYDDEVAYLSWVNNTTNLVYDNLRTNVIRLLAHPNVKVILTDLYNPINPNSYLYYLPLIDVKKIAKKQNPFACIGNNCANRIEYLITKLNSQYVQVYTEVDKTL